MKAALNTLIFRALPHFLLPPSLSFTISQESRGWGASSGARRWQLKEKRKEKKKISMRSSRGFDVRDWDGRLDKVRLARRDWQPSPWKRKQKGPYINRGKWSWSSRKIALYDVTRTLWNDISTDVYGTHTHAYESGRTKICINFSVYCVCASTQDVWVFRPITALCLFMCLKETSMCPLCSCSYCVSFTNGLLSPCLFFLPLSSPPFSPISYPCIPLGAD